MSLRRGGGIKIQVKKMDERKEKIMTEVLRNVPFDGWTERVLKEAVKTCGYDVAYAEILFPGGVGEVVDMFVRSVDQRMLQVLEDLPLCDMKIRERIATAIKVRLEQNLPYRQAIRRAITFYAMPHNAARAAKSLWNTADSIWYAAGDTATDYNYYTKRLLLGGVYSTTLLFWLDDHSENFQDTYAFLDRRISDVLKIGDIRKAGEGIKKKLRTIPFIRLAFL
jgi:ubiquinone biosynthesis protein COQ9